ncbi:MAG: hypothetical protein NVSMB31_00400 [Vulcanimicrobiaceae bacterium]
MRDFFRGKYSLRTRGERTSFWITLLFAPAILSLAGHFIHEAAGFSTIVFLAVIAMIYVTLARGQLIGSSVLIDHRHFPHVFSVVEACAAKVGIPVPLVFVRDDLLVPAVALGFGEPYALVLSSHWLTHFQDDELAFIVGRELGNIAAGHTRLTSLLSANGKENALVSLICGAWLRRTEYTADRFGLLCCGSVDAASRALIIATFHRFGRDIDLAAFSRQRDEFSGDSVLSMGEWLSAQPYATNRIARLETFSHSPLYAYWKEQLADAASVGAPMSSVLRSGQVTRADCAGFGRRAAALIIDLIVVSSIFALTPANTEATPSPESQKAVSHAVQKAHGDPANAEGLPIDVPTVKATLTDKLLRLAGYVHTTATGAKGSAPVQNYEFVAMSFPDQFLLYCIVLVALGGQTLGMMILAIKVTTTSFRRPPIWQTVWRYIVSPLGILTYALGPLARIELHDRLSGTRVVRLERTFERAALPPAV